jgi:hypothetical protein
MVEITFIIPKYRIAKCNRGLWKSNKHKRPFYFVSELNNAIRRDEEKVYKILFRDYFKAFYSFKR